MKKLLSFALTLCLCAAWSVSLAQSVSADLLPEEQETALDSGTDEPSETSHEWSTDELGDKPEDLKTGVSGEVP